MPLSVRRRRYRMPEARDQGDQHAGGRAAAGVFDFGSEGFDVAEAGVVVDADVDIFVAHPTLFQRAITVLNAVDRGLPRCGPAS